MIETRKLAAILVADFVSYSRLAGAEEERTLARLRALRSDLVDPTIALLHGRIVQRTGDSIIEFRVGIHVGDVVEESDGDLMGDGVNFPRHLTPDTSTRTPAPERSS
jgi:adenylate cyclase